MVIFEAIRLALHQIRVQKLKSAFTLLGVTIGVMFLVAVVSVVNGMSRYVEQDFAGRLLGVNTFYLQQRPDIVTTQVSDATWKEWRHRPPLRLDDADAVHAALPAGVHWAIVDRRTAQTSSAYSRGGPEAEVEAVTTEYFAIKNLVVTQGRIFTDQEDAYGTPVVVIGIDVAHDLFPGLNAVGRELRIGGVPFRVIGVLEKQGSLFGLSLDRQIIGPFRSPLSSVPLGNPVIHAVAIQSPSPAALVDARDRVREVMRQRHKLHPDQADDFTFEDSESALTEWAQLKQYLVAGSLVLPAVGLLVGAILIMNIMLVAVAERTHEIGVRKAIGARYRDILFQFLCEATTLSLLGALIGIVLGCGLSALVAAVSPLPAVVAPWSIGVAVALGVGVGVTAGSYPASRAARLDPIAALHAE